MSVKKRRIRQAYGIGSPLHGLNPLPIIATVDPSASDIATLGAMWINTVTSGVFILTSVTAGAANWSVSPGSGATTLASLSVDPGNLVVTDGDATISTGDLTVTSGNTVLGGDLTVSGVTTIAGDFDLTSAFLIDLTSSLDAAPSILLRANGGTSEQIRLHSVQGIAPNAIELDSDVGGITLVSGLAADDSININAPVGGVDIDGALQVNIASSQAAADAIIINASAASGGVQIQAGSNGILIGNEADTAIIDIGDVVPTSARTITVSGGAISTAIADILDLAPDGATTNAGASKVVNINAGALDTATLTTNIASGNVASGTHTVNLSTGTGAKAVNVGNADDLTVITLIGDTSINAGTSADTFINTGIATGAVSIGSATAGAIDIESSAASNFSVNGAGVDLTLDSAAGRVIINGEEAANDAVTIFSAAGGVAVDGALQVNIDSSQAAAADSVRIVASAADGGIDIDSGTGGIAIDSTGAIVLQSSVSIDLNASGIVGVGAATDTDATGPAATAAVTINANVGLATLQGFTQAAGATLVLTVTNSVVTAGSAILLSASNLGANDSQMTVTRILPGAGTFDVTLTNNGAAANNGDILVTFWVLN